MIICEYCSSKIKGIRFCTPKHKMAYVRSHPEIYKKEKAVLPMSNTAIPLLKSNKKEVETIINRCVKHNMLVGLCKFGCKK